MHLHEFQSIYKNITWYSFKHSSFLPSAAVKSMSNDLARALHNIIFLYVYQAWSNLKTANKSEMRCLRSSTACPILMSW